MKKSANHYVLSLEADGDIEEIFEYTKAKYGIHQAISYVTDFEVCFSQLVETPNIGKRRDEIKKGLYSFPKREHTIFYRILTNKIRIIRILHSSRDLPKYF